MLNVHVISFLLLFGGANGIRLTHVRSTPYPIKEYTGYDEKKGWEFPKTGWKTWHSAFVMQKWKQAHFHDVANLRKSAERGECKVVLIGDSITELFVRGSFNSGQKDPEKIMIKDDVRIFALGGDRFRDQGWRLFEGGGIEAIQACKPEKVFMMLGTNDFENPPDYNGTIDLHTNHSIQDFQNLFSQLRQKLPESTELIVHPVLSRCCSNREQTANFVQYMQKMDEQFHAAVVKANDAQRERHGLINSRYADCSDAISANESHYLDGIHLKTDGLVAFGRCLQSRHGIQMMVEDSEPHGVERESVDCAIRPLTCIDKRLGHSSHESLALSKQRPVNKLVVLVGDSVDRNVVSDLCESHMDAGASLSFAQPGEAMDQFGPHSKMGKVDPYLMQKLQASQNPAWKAWMVHVCHLPALHATVASVFNLRGVSKTRPWWHDDVMEAKFNMKFRKESTEEFLAPPIRAIQELYSQPSWQHATVINSNFWDADREHYKLKTWKAVENYVSEQWSEDAGDLIDAVKKIVPETSKMYWRTANLPSENTDGSLGYGSQVSEGQSGSKDVVKLINAAAVQVAGNKGLQVLNWESIATEPVHFYDGMHPTGHRTVPEIEKLLHS